MLESSRGIDAVLLDKTGTVTTGAMQVTALHSAGETGSADGFDDVTVLRLSGALESSSEHPVARAITNAARESLGSKAGTLSVPESFQNHQGYGVSGVVRGREVLVGRRKFLAGQGIEVPPEVGGLLSYAESRGSTPVLVGIDGRFAGVVIVADTVKESAAGAVARLKELGMEPLLLTGDNEGAARRVAASVGVDQVIAEACRETRWRPSGICRRRGRLWPWWATASTTPQHWLRPISASPWGPAPTSPSTPPTSQ